MSFIEKFIESKPFRVSLEAIFIGGYTLILFLVLTCIIGDVPIYVIFFLLGCIKHYSGYIVGLHDRFCRGCSKDKRSIPPTAFEIVGEGLIILVIELLLHCIFSNIYLNVFVLGALLHMGFEFFGLHRRFCKTHCIL